MRQTLVIPVLYLASDPHKLYAMTTLGTVVASVGLVVVAPSPTDADVLFSQTTRTSLSSIEWNW